MKTSNTLVVRVLGLGNEGRAAVSSVAGAVRELWGEGAVVQVETACAGDNAGHAARSIRAWCDRDRVDVVLTVGCSGHAGDAFAPEMTAALLDRALPGVEERMYLAPGGGRPDLLFRGRAGMRKGTLVVNLPARAARFKVVLRFLGPVVPHAVEKARGSDRDCTQPGGRTS